MIDVSNENVPGLFLLLKVAFQTKSRVAFGQQSLVNRPVGCMADHTTLAQCLVLIHERAALRGVALEACLVSAQESKAAGFQRLLNVRASAYDRVSLVRIVAVGTAHLAFGHRMMMRQLERRANFQVTLETGLRRFSWIDDRASTASGFDMQTPGSVARFAAHIRDLFWSFAALCAGLTYHGLFCLQSRVGGCSEVAHDLFVTGGAFL